MENKSPLQTETKHTYKSPDIIFKKNKSDAKSQQKASLDAWTPEWKARQTPQVEQSALYSVIHSAATKYY